MTCNCGSGDTPEYYITLDGVGVDGYSPEVNIVDEDTASFKIQTVNKSNTQTTLAIPKLTYLQSTYATSSDLTTGLANKLNKNGNNATTPFWFGANNDFVITRDSFSQGHNNVTSLLTYPYYNSAFNLNGLYIYRDENDYKVHLGGNTSRHLVLRADTRIGQDKEIATVDHIPTVGNGTITLTQNGVTKGTFTTNQSGSTTINLDSGVTNPLSIENSDGTRSLSLGINSDNQAYMYYTVRSTTAGGVGGFSIPVGLLYLSSNTIDFTKRNADGLYTIEAKEMVGCDSITAGATGLVPAPSAGDQDKFLKADGTWDTVGGGSSYTEGTGIDITNDTISVDESVVMTTSNQSSINFGAKQFSNIIVANGFNTGVGLIGKKNVSGALYLAQVSTSDDVILGDSTAPLYLMGSNDRPKYTGGNVTAKDLALYSDLPDVSDMATKTWVGNQGYLTSSDLSGYATETWVGQQGYALASSLATVATSGSYADLQNKPTIPTNADYLDLTSNQTAGGNKTFTGTTYLRNTYICNASGTYFGRMRAVDNKFTFEGIGTNRSINFIPDGTGELQYNGTEVATVNDIPDVSQLQEKLTAGDGIKLSKGINIPLEQTLPYTFNSSYRNTKFVSASNFDQTKERVVVIEVPVSTAYTQFYMSNESRRGFNIDTNDLSNIWVFDGDSYGAENQTSFPVSGSHNYLKFVIDTDNTFDVYYGYDNLTWTLLLSKDRSNQKTDTWEYGVNVYNEGTTGWTLDYLEAFYPIANGEVISCDDTIATKSYVDSIVGNIETLLSQI